MSTGATQSHGRRDRTGRGLERMNNDKLPCGCTIETDDKMLSSVFWNIFNSVVQCHKCGHVYEPKVYPNRSCNEIAKRYAADDGLWTTQETVEANLRRAMQEAWQLAAQSQASMSPLQCW